MAATQSNVENERKRGSSQNIHQRTREKAGETRRSQTELPVVLAKKPLSQARHAVRLATLVKRPWTED
jgi:hypothetical protein